MTDLDPFIALAEGRLRKDAIHEKEREAIGVLITQLLPYLESGYALGDWKHYRQLDGLTLYQPNAVDKPWLYVRSDGEVFIGVKKRWRWRWIPMDDYPDLGLEGILKTLISWKRRIQESAQKLTTWLDEREAQAKYALASA